MKNITETTKVCPGEGCERRIYKDGGCDHMKCKTQTFPLKFIVVTDGAFTKV